jgi:hypothetical protein
MSSKVAGRRDIGASHEPDGRCADLPGESMNTIEPEASMALL